MNNKSKPSVLIEIATYLLVNIFAVFMGVWVSVGVFLEPLAALFGLPSNLRQLKQAEPYKVELLTVINRTWINLTACLALFLAVIAPSFLTAPHVTIALALASIVGLGWIGLRGIEHAASSSNEFSTKYLVIGNLSATVLSAVIAAYLAPSLNPQVLIASVITGWLLVQAKSSEKLPAVLALLLPLAYGLGVGYYTAGLLGTAVVAVGAAIQIKDISSGLTGLSEHGDNESYVKNSRASYALSLTILQTTFAAAVLTGLFALVR